MGEFARRELSPLPWVAFANALTRHGLGDALFQLMSVLLFELWALWIPGHLYVRSRPTLDKRTVLLARSLNLAVGLLLLTPGNPIYGLIELLPSWHPDE